MIIEQEETKKLPKGKLVIPIVYGSISACTGKRGNDYFYKWMIFLKAAKNHELDHIIENVKFYLHESFEDTLRSKLKSKDSDSLSCG